MTARPTIPNCAAPSLSSAMVSPCCTYETGGFLVCGEVLELRSRGLVEDPGATAGELGRHLARVARAVERARHGLGLALAAREEDDRARRGDHGRRDRHPAGRGLGRALDDDDAPLRLGELRE